MWIENMFLKAKFRLPFVDLTLRHVGATFVNKTTSYAAKTTALGYLEKRNLAPLGLHMMAAFNPNWHLAEITEKLKRPESETVLIKKG